MAKSNSGRRIAALQLHGLSSTLVTCLWMTTAICACSGSSTSPGSGTGGNAAGGVATTAGGSSAGGASASGGATTSESGGSNASGGANVGGNVAVTGGASNGGTSSSNGGAVTGGAQSNGGRATGGVQSNGGGSATGGNPATGGAVSSVGGSTTGGTPATGGVQGSVGGSTTGGNKATGGNSSVGGQSATGGSLATGGTGAAAGAGGDRCDVAVYNASTPPVSYTITGGPSVHDPTVILAGGVYYSANSGLSLWTRNSTNLTSWTNIKQGLGGTNPSWIKTYVTAFDQAGGDLWAPDFSYFGGQYHLYYAASTFGSKTSCLGHATRAAMNTGSWTDSGAPLICSNSAAFGSYTSVNWNTIDPAVILDESGNPWLVFGSGWDGIQIVRLTSSGTIDSTSTITNIAKRTAGVLENSYMVRRCGYYYLFMSWDKCCAGASSTYNIRVGRSTSMTGGFVDKDGVALLSGGGTKLMGDGNGWVGPGAPVIVFNGTRAYIVYHAYDATATTNVFAMHVSDIYWDASGWPVTTASP